MIHQPDHKLLRTAERSDRVYEGKQEITISNLDSYKFEKI